MSDRRIWTGGRFCGPLCKSGYLSDIRHGLMYGAHALLNDDGSRRFVSRRAFCADQMICVYCNADLEHATGTVR